MGREKGKDKREERKGEIVEINGNVKRKGKWDE